MKTKTIHLVNQHMTYKQRYRARRKTLGFHEKHFTQAEGVIPFGYMSYKMWLTKIYGGFKIVVLKMEDKDEKK